MKTKLFLSYPAPKRDETGKCHGLHPRSCAQDAEHAHPLDEWLFNLSERDYQQCAKGHRDIGTIKGGKFLGMVNVESIGGNLRVQRYTSELLEPLHIRLFSARSRGYLMHLLPFHLQVLWEMEAVPISASESRLRCTIDVRNPLWARLGGVFIGANHWILRHLIEETHGFARDIEGKHAVIFGN